MPKRWKLRMLACATATAAALSGCAEPVVCKPCPGNRVQLTAHQSIVRPDHTYELCDARGVCSEGQVAASGPSGSPTPAAGTGATAGTQLPVAVVNLPGDATGYSRMSVQAVIKDARGRIIGEGEATFPEYPQVESEPCHCYNAFVQVDIYPRS
ncbi:hypothetical protein Plo01_10200 [Planobispora longispora]|uniref:Lipoprotein n=1 Tax=Planobispora longispora TaxID=28887 RepID=A0A8J3RE69_9ACTN|nr:hypothetical protein GCM10020093_094660 [Planobispora longispora]GIH74591.1 hypothetical protein Plo01_10200 [Planobispora longispora]